MNPAKTTHSCWTNRARFLMIILSSFVAIWGFIFLITVWDKFDLGILISDQTSLTEQVAFTLCLIAQYWILSSVLISFCIYKKGGYKNLKSRGENGLIDFLIFGFVAAFIAALTFKLITEASIGEFILGLIFALSIIMVMAPVCGIPSELKPQTNHF